MNKRDLILHDEVIFTPFVFYFPPSLYFSTHSPAVLLLKTDAMQHKEKKKKTRETSSDLRSPVVK